MQNRINYNCTQQELYEVAHLGWQNYKDNLIDFTNHKATYTQAFGEAATAALLSAQNLPDDRALGSLSETLRIQFEDVAGICLSNWQKLKSYITNVYSGEEQRAMLQAAGLKYYRQASNKSWPQIESMLNSASQFIADNSEALSRSGNNMPAKFPTKFSIDKTMFQTKYSEFLESTVSDSADNSAKIIANNEVYDSLIKMFADGQIIYKNDPVKKALFVFSTLLNYISAPKHAGLRIVAKEKNTELPIAGFSVIAQPGNVRGVTDENGVLILSLYGNTYSITGIKEGYTTFTEDVNITTGIIYRKNVELIKTS